MDINYLLIHHDELLAYLHEHDYSATYVNRYKATIKQITDNASNHRWNTYEDVYQWYVSQNYSPTYLHELRAIIGKLEQFHLYGNFPDNKRSYSSLWKIKSSYTKLNMEYKQLYEDFKTQTCKGLKSSTVTSYKTKISSFLYELQCKGATTLSKVTEKDVQTCFFTDGIRKRTGTISATIRRFLKILSDSGNEEATRILAYIPNLRIARKNIDYLTDVEVTKIRQALEDNESSLSYKDRAVGRLLLHTGLRGIDIACMQLDFIDWNNDKLSIVQKKTSQPLELPLLPVVGNAIYDYCINERPVSNSHYLFLDPRAPHNNLTTDGIGCSVTKIMSVANIRQEKGRRKGTHIFRHHLAITMLANGVPQPVITGTMGHTAPESLSSYLHADMKHLRQCALSVEDFPIAKEVFQSCLK